MFLVCFWVYPSYTEMQQIWSYIDIEITCLKELLVTKKITKTPRVQDIVSIWYVAARTLCLVVDSQVKVWSCTLSYKNCHLTLSCLQHDFNTILTIFAKLKYYFDFDKFAMTLQPSRNEELCPFPILIEKCRVCQLLWCGKTQSSCMYFHVFPYQNLICFFSIGWKEAHLQRITYHKLTELFWLIIWQMLEKIATSEVSLFLFRWNMWHLSRKQLIKFSFWFWHRKNDTRLYSYTSSFVFHIKSPIIY